MHYVCATSVDLLADSEKFPEDWLFKHRWGKGKKNQSSVLPNGEKIAFLTVGGRTSAIVPSVQKKTGAVTKGADEAEATEGNSKRKRSAVQKQEDDSDEESQPKRSSSQKQNKSKPSVKEEEKDNVPSGRRRSARVKN